MRKGPSRKETCVTSLSFYPAQLRWLQHAKIDRGLSSVAELIRSLVDREMSEHSSANDKKREQNHTLSPYPLSDRPAVAEKHE
mgnify:FL=1